MMKSNQHGKPPPTRPQRRMSMFTAGQTMYPVTGWANRGQPPPMTGPRRASIWRRDSVKTEGSSLQQVSKPVVQLENTYKAEPDAGCDFREWKMKKHMEDILREQLASRQYDEKEVQRLTLQICSMIKQQAKDIGCPRYKFISHVVIGQNTDQSVHTVSRGLWDNHYDGFASATFRNESLFAVATVFGVYYE